MAEAAAAAEILDPEGLPEALPELPLEALESEQGGYPLQPREGLLALEYYEDPEDPPEELQEDSTDVDERLGKQRKLRTHFKEHPTVPDSDYDHSSNEKPSEGPTSETRTC